MHVLSICSAYVDFHNITFGNLCDRVIARCTTAEKLSFEPEFNLSDV